MPAVELETLPRDRAIALAVSGGVDSTALMLLAGRRIDPENLTVLTVDHGLRAAAADEARTVAGWAAALGLKHVTLRWLGEKPDAGIQAAARRARYDLMSDWCVAHDVTCLVTAHTLDDRAETVLMRLKRGSGVDGLAAMSERSLRSGTLLLRPLLDVSRDRLVGVLEEAGHPWLEDPSNADERFERVRIRNDAKTLDRMGLGREKLGAVARRMVRAREALERATGEFLASSAEVSGYGFCRLRLEGLSRAADEIAIRALARCVRAIGGKAHPPGDESLERLLEWLRSGAPSSRTLGGCRLIRRGADLVVARELGRIVERDLRLPGDGNVVWDGRFRVSAAGSERELSVGPLAEEGWERLGAERPPLPAFVGQTLPAICRNDRIVAVPSIAYVSPELVENLEFSATFANSRLISGKTAQ